MSSAYVFQSRGDVPNMTLPRDVTSLIDRFAKPSPPKTQAQELEDMQAKLARERTEKERELGLSGGNVNNRKGKKTNKRKTKGKRGRKTLRKRTNKRKTKGKRGGSRRRR